MTNKRGRPVSAPKSEFWKLAREAMDKKDMTVSTLADLLGVKQNTVSGWFSGARGPGFKTGARVILLLGMPLRKSLLAVVSGEPE
jgi:transcriptional regulator with XRE-family HTH domain